MKYIFRNLCAFLLFQIVSPFSAQSQISEIDSCLNALKHCKEDTNKVLLLNSIAWDTSYQNLQIGLNYAEQAFALAKKLDYQKGLAKVNMTMGSALMDMGRHDEAMKHFQDALKISEANNFYSTKRTLLVNMGVLYVRREEYKQAISSNMNAILIYKKYNDTLKMYTAMNNIAEAYYYLHNIDSALFFIKKCITHNKRVNAPARLSYNYNVLGKIYNYTKEYQKALDYNEEGNVIARKNRDNYLLSYGLEEKAEILMNMKRYPEAIAALEESIKMSKASGEIDVTKECNLKFSRAYETMGDYKKSLSYFKEYTIAKDSILNTKNSNQIRFMEMEFDNEKKDKENKLLQVQNQISQSTIKQQKIIAFAGVAGLVMAFLVIIVIFRFYQKEKKSKHIINLQKTIVDSKNKEIIDSISYAKTIQQAIIPSFNEVKSVFPNNFILLLPKDIVSGDFYWIGKKQDYQFAIVADCTGHGVPGGFMSMLGTTLLNEIINEKNIFDPADILDLLKLKIIMALRQSDNVNESKDGMDIAVCRIHKATKQLTFAGANNSVYVIRNNEVIQLKGNKQPIGISNSNYQFSQETISLSENDTIYMFTDGYPDQFGGIAGKKFKSKQLEQLLVKIHTLQLQEQHNILISTLKQWQGGLEQVDDICVVGIKI